MHEIRLQRCDECGYIRAPESFACPECLSQAATWTVLSGDGTVETFVWYLEHLDPHPDGAPAVPYNVAVVRLAEGPALITNVTGVAFGELAVGDAVRAAGDPAVLRFAPVR